MLAIVAKATIKDGAQDAFEETAAKLAAEVKANEPGCLLYLLTRSPEDASCYVFIERYADEAALKAHMKAPHMRTHGRALAECMQGPPEITVLQDV